jgi:hypothetical protein
MMARNPALARQSELWEEAKKELIKEYGEFLNRWIPWQAKAKELHADLEAINQESRLLANYPGWSDMAQILKSSASIRHFEGEESEAQKRTVALRQWSQKWQANGGKIYEESRLLLNRIAVAEGTFQALEYEYKQLDIFHTEYVQHMLAALQSPDEKLVGFILNFEDMGFNAPSSKIRSELSTLLKKPLITLGFIEREKL